MDTVKAYYFDIPDLLKHGNGVEVHHHLELDTSPYPDLGNPGYYVDKITASIYINLEALKSDTELSILEAEAFEDKPETLMLQIANNQTALLNAIDRIIETGASVTIGKVDTVVAKVEEVGNGSVKQNHNDDTDVILDHPVTDDTSGHHQDLKEKTDTSSKTDTASDLGYDLPPIQCDILGISKYFKVEDSKGVDIVLNPIDGKKVTEEEYTQVKKLIDEAVAEAKKVCKPTAFIVVDVTDSKSNNYVYYVTVRPTTDEEAEAANAFYRVMRELSYTHDNIINLTSTFDV